MTLRELQEITDSVGMVSVAEIRDYYKCYSDEKQIPYDCSPLRF